MNPEVQAMMPVAQRALELVPDGAALGLGSGRASTAFVHALGQRVQAGFRVRGVPTSRATEELARQLGIPLVTLADVPELDLTVDGADEVDPHLNLIKGYGRALVREKIVAAASKKLVILVDPPKLVSKLGSRGKLPVEVLPFALEFCRRRLLELFQQPAVPYEEKGRLFVTDNGNHILDCQVGPLDEEPAAVEDALRRIPGVVGTGLFVGMAHTVLVQVEGTVEVKHRSHL